MPNRDERTDRIAREAARLVLEGGAETVRDAIRQSTWLLDRLHAAEPRAAVDLPTVKLVRDHVRGMRMQELGLEGYRERIVSIWHVAEEVMTVLEEYEPELLGRAAEGNVDGDFRLHIRIYTRQPLSGLAQQLVDFEYDEPAFSTADTKFGRFSRIELEEEGIPIVITRCMPHDHHVRRVDLYSGGSITTLDLKSLRNRIDEMRSMR